MTPAPRWLLAFTLLSLALVAGLLWAEVHVWRPYYSVGDEAYAVRGLMDRIHGGPAVWAWAQGGIRREAQFLWWRWLGSGPGRLQDLGLLAFAVELGLLALVARRWISPAGAAVAVLADLLCADAWMRVRSILAFSWLPAELLLLAWAAGKVRGRWAAALWGAVAGLLTLDYEGASLALPGLLAVCLSQEAELRRQGRWAFGAAGATVAVILARQTRAWSDYLGVRHAASLGGGPAYVLAHWARNLWQLLVGGDPIAYFSVQHWPAFALWALPLLGLGLALAWRQGRRAWVAWAAMVVLLSQADRASWGVPAHRLSAAWPILCLAAGLGGAWALERLPARSIKWAVLLLALGASAEADAYFRHMAVYGSRQWGHSANMAGAEALLAAEAPGCAVDSAMLELRYPELAYHVRSRAGLGQDAWVLLPPEYRLLAPALGELRLQRSGANDEPVLMLRARGPAARRFDAIDADLRRTLPLPERKEGCLALEERALAQGPHDEWAWWLLQGQSLRHRVELGLPWDPAAIGQWQAHPPLSPGPWVELGRQLQADAPERGMQAYDKALALDPLYAPAFIRRLEALERQGRVAEAEAQRQANQAAQAAGAWTIAE